MSAQVISVATINHGSGEQPPLTHPRADYILVAIPNTGRASSIRTLALEFCPTVVVVRDGQDAIQQLDRLGPPRLLIVELSLPRVDGFGVVRHLRATASAARSAVLVASAHESFRNAARQLAETMGIAKVLPLDVDRAPLKRAIAALVNADEGANQSPIQLFGAPRVGRPDDQQAFEDRLHFALLDLTRQFHVPMAAASLQMGEQRRFAAYVSIADGPATLDFSSAPEFLAQATQAVEPLIVPELEGHAVLGQAASGSAIRGFAGAPLLIGGGRSAGALGLFDTKTLGLTAVDIDTFAEYASEVARHLAPVPVPAPVGVAEAKDRDFEALEQLAATDPLTGLSNRRGCEKSIAGEISRAERERKPLSCILLDVDRFKQVNDTLGHQAGDQVLRELSTMLRQSVRAYDIVARWGGEEFLLVLPGADIEAARLLAERIRAGVQTLPNLPVGGLTISAGVSEFDSHYDFEATLRLADRRLYEAKSAGRNSVR